MLNINTMFKTFWTTLGDLFTATFEILPIIGNTINYIYMVIIFLFLVAWTVIMFKHKRNGEEHRSL